MSGEQTSRRPAEGRRGAIAVFTLQRLAVTLAVTGVLVLALSLL